MPSQKEILVMAGVTLVTMFVLNRLVASNDTIRRLVRGESLAAATAPSEG